MSAPAALAVSKLFWPETEKSITKQKDVFNMKKRLYIKKYLINIYNTRKQNVIKGIHRLTLLSTESV